MKGRPQKAAALLTHGVVLSVEWLLSCTVGEKSSHCANGSASVAGSEPAVQPARQHAQSANAPPIGSPKALRVGRHLVISTSHIRPATADLLDQWAPMVPESRPLGVAEAGYGWFVLTDPLDGLEREMVPNELWAAIEFARAQGCRWLLLDRDADCIDGLETFEW